MTTAKAILQSRASVGRVTLVAAVQGCEGVFANTETVALLYSPTRCWLTKVTYQDARCNFIGLSLERADNKTKALEKPLDEAIINSIFEARIFSPAAELRWLHRDNGEGDAALIADEATDITGCLAQDLPPLKAIHTLKQTYLLWGEGVHPSKANLPDGWSRLTTARIGKLDVPVKGVDDDKNKRVQLKAVEYLAEYDANGNVVQDDKIADDPRRYGNVAVVEERLLRLEVAQ